MESNFDKGRKEISNRLKDLIIIPEKIRQLRQELNKKFSSGGITKNTFDTVSTYLDKIEDEHYTKTPGLKEMINEVFSQIVEKKLCAKGKRYIAKRKAAGEKSSAYLSGRAVKVCKGQMKG